MTAGQFREKLLAYRRAFDGAPERAQWRSVRLAARLGLAPLARFVLSDQVWLGIVLADLEKFCHAAQTTHVYSQEDPHGRDSATLEGRRQVYLRIREYLALTPLEESRIVDSLNEDTEEIQRHAS